jgi:hypothetical protein
MIGAARVRHLASATGFREEIVEKVLDEALAADEAAEVPWVVILGGGPYLST